MENRLFKPIEHKWDDLIALLTKLKEQGYEPETMDDLLELFDSGTLNPDDYEFPCGDNYETFKCYVKRGYYDIGPKSYEPVYTREPGNPATYPPREFVERYDRGEFTNCHFDFAGGPKEGYERLKADILRGFYD